MSLKQPAYFVELSEIFSRFESDFLDRYPQPLENLQLINLIKICRTAKLGGHLHKCGDCGHEKPVYNSCRHRFCPKCQTLSKERWLEKRKTEFIPASYFHGVFTIPHELNYIALRNKKIIYSILYKAVSKTLQKFANQEYEGQLGFISVLHTWNQKLSHHIHLHCIIPGGVFNRDLGKWKKIKSSTFLFPIKALSLVFKAKFIDYLRKESEKLKLDNLYQDPKSWNDYLDSLWSKEWIVYAKRSFSGPDQVIEYLGRYTHRIAISNYRILKIEGSKVHFKYRDRKDENKEKIMELNAVEFLRRFMLHTLPKRFTKIRYHGYLSNRYKNSNISLIYESLKIERIAKEMVALSVADFVKDTMGIDISVCPHCGSKKICKVKINSRGPP